MPITPLKVVASTNDPADVKRKINDLMNGKPSLSPRTCYHKVGLYLHEHPETRGTVYLYGVEGQVPPYVYHATLLDDHGRTLVDGFKQNSSPSTDIYLRPDGEHYVLLDTMSINGW